MITRKKRKQKAATKTPSAALPAGVNVVPAPKSATLRKLLSGPDITTSGGARTIHTATVRH
jgi:hypothetical protein